MAPQPSSPSPRLVPKVGMVRRGLGGGGGGHSSSLYRKGFV